MSTYPMPHYDDRPEDYAVLSDPSYQGKYILYAPPCREGMFYRFTTPSEEAAMDAADEEIERQNRVYFIQEGESGPIKIGHSWNVSKRLSSLQNASPRPLRVLATMPGGKRQEKKLHAQFSSHRLRGEWFACAPEILAFIEEVRTCELRK